MIMKRITTVFLAVALIATIAPNCFGQYTTDWVANTFGTNATRVGNVARSMWWRPRALSIRLLCGTKTQAVLRSTKMVKV
jgi:hypothetical protein